MERPPCEERLEHPVADPFAARSRILITGGSGQLGVALRQVFPNAEAPDRTRLDVTTEVLQERPDLVLHAAAWTDVDGAEVDPAAAERVNVEGTRNIVALGAPVVYFSSDYVFDGAKGAPYVESDMPVPLSVYGDTKLRGELEIRSGWIVRTSWLFSATGRNFVRTMLALSQERSEVRVVADQRGTPTYVGHLAEATARILHLPYGTYHAAADGDCTWAEFAQAIFDQAGSSCRVIPITSAEAGRRARRPAYSVLRSEHPGTPRLPHWREGLAECLERLL